MRTMGMAMLVPAAFCVKGRNAAKDAVSLDVVVHSYIDRPILDILFNGSDLGIAGAYGGTGTITGVRVPFGVQVLTWRLDGSKDMKRLGETVTARNQLLFREEDITEETRYIGLHLYPDDTAEMEFSAHIPELSTRGEQIMRTKQGR